MVRNVTVLLVIALITGCGGRNLSIAVPDWYLSPPNNPEMLVGTGQAVSEDMGIARNQAVSLARVDLARSIEARVEALIETNQGQAGSMNPQVTQYFNQAAREVLQQDMMGVRTESVEMIDNPDGAGYMVWALVVQDIAAANKALLDRMRAQEALYAEFQKTQAFERLDAEIKRFEQSRQVPQGARPGGVR